MQSASAVSHTIILVKQLSLTDANLVIEGNRPLLLSQVLPDRCAAAAERLAKIICEDRHV